MRISKDRATVIAGAVVFVALVGWVCRAPITMVACGIVFPGACARVDLHDVEEIAELRFPKHAHLRSGTYTQWMDWELFAVVDIPASTEAQFLTGNALPLPNPREIGVPIVPGIEDWRPDLVAEFGGMSNVCTASTCRDIMLGYDERGVVVIYIHVLSDDQPYPTAT